MDIHALWRVIFRFTRRRRMERFGQQFHVGDQTRVLDVGGTPHNWLYLRATPRVTMLNIRPPASDARDLRPHLAYLEGDALAPPPEVRDTDWDIVFSNSVIEHLHSWPNQRRFAEACRALGGKLWIQTPAKAFFIEPHYLTPFIHWLPPSWRRRLGRWTVWGLLTQPSREQVEERVQEIRLLTRKEIQEIFPDCRIVVERFLGLPKSYIAVRDAPA